MSEFSNDVSEITTYLCIAYIWLNHLLHFLECRSTSRYKQRFKEFTRFLNGTFPWIKEIFETWEENIHALLTFQFYIFWKSKTILLINFFDGQLKKSVAWEVKDLMDHSLILEVSSSNKLRDQEILSTSSGEVKNSRHLLH